MKRSIRCLSVSLMLTVLASVAFAGTPLVSGDVIVGESKTRYIYTVTNNQSSDPLIGLYDIWVPSYISIGHNEPANWIFSRKTRNEFWDVISWESNTLEMLQPGQSAVFEIYTSASLETFWGLRAWKVGAIFEGDRRYFFNDGTALPVPVPEPSSLLALSGGILGYGALRLRKRPR